MADLRRPTNLRIIAYLNGSVEIMWDKALSQDVLFYIISGLSISTSSWQVLGTTNDNRSVISNGFSAVKINAAYAGEVTSDDSNILALAVANASDINMAAVIGQDELGQKRFLAVTPEGVLKVTGATVSNTGGDASAANQVTQISLANSNISKLTDAVAALNNVLNKLSSVGLGAATISALQNTSVNNFPSNYPDSAALAAINALAAATATATGQSALLTELQSVLNTADLNLDTSKRLVSIIDNLPIDYPDAGANAKLASALSELGNILIKLNDLSIYIEATALASETIANNAIISSARLTSLDAVTQAAGLSDVARNSLLTDIAALVSALQIITDTISANTLNALKSTDLSLNAGVLNTAISNLPSDYPDAAAGILLSNIQNYLNLISQGLDVSLTNSLPAGNNLIGSVNINALPLADDAARDSTLSGVTNALASINNKILAIAQTVTDILNGLATLNAIISERLVQRKKIIDTVVSITENSAIVRPLDLVSSDLADLNKFNKYTLEVLSYNTAIAATIRRESSYENNNFYHKMHEKNLNASDSLIFSFDIPAQNISIKLSKLIEGAVAGARVVLYGGN